ncbi:MAG TPA: hypothetical protein PLD84_16465 [Chitinophagales bacterium]|nr:hypothetical protein [Chitinophagales bacterium]
MNLKNLFNKKPKQEITLRDEIAVRVIPEIIRERGQLNNGYAGCSNVLESDCHFAYRIADEMLKARDLSIEMKKFNSNW